MGSIRRSKTKRRTRYIKPVLTRVSLLTHLDRDLDQVKADIASSKHLAQYQSTKAAEDLPGLGQWYCIECAKWFEGEHNLVAHRKGKNHKRRLGFCDKSSFDIRLTPAFQRAILERRGSYAKGC